MAGKWVVRLTEAAQQDLDQIYVWTADWFGPTQAERYRRIILDTLNDLRDGPFVIGASSHVELPGIYEFFM
jgi:plasmid stabilization system protein ParE